MGKRDVYVHLMDLEAAVERQKKRIKELEAENKMLHRSLAAKPDTATSSGAAQAAMEYEIDLRERRIAQLQTQAADYEYNAAQIITARDKRIAELEARYESALSREQGERILRTRAEARLDAVEDWLLTCSTIGRDARSQLKAILEGEK